MDQRNRQSYLDPDRFQFTVAVVSFIFLDIVRRLLKLTFYVVLLKLTDSLLLSASMKTPGKGDEIVRKKEPALS